MASDTHYNRDVLQKLLTDSLPDHDEAGISDHLATCSDCRHEFEVLAAANEWWSEASERLSRIATRREKETRIGIPSDDDDLNFTTDFAVDFLDPSDETTSLGRLGEYEIVAVIGRGGMGIVLKGFQKELHRHVAVKVLSPHLATSGAARRRFAREAQATAAVVHPHVMAIHSVNANAKLPYLVMPYIDCQSLQQRIDLLGSLDVKDVLRIGMQTALGLSAAHAQGLVHRDVKPANILLETNVDRVLLTDFGLARAVDDATLTRTGIIAGTPQYMSPEQANGDGVDHRSDLFSLGGVMYAMCTARPPFRAETTFGVLRRIRDTPPRLIRQINPDVPEWLECIVMKLLDKHVSQRFTSAQEVATVLEQCLAHVQQPTSVELPESVADLVPAAAPLATPTPPARRPVPIAIATVLILMFAASVWWLLTRDNRRVPQTSIAPSTKNAIPALSPSEPIETTEEIPRWNDVHREINAAERLVEELESMIHGEDESPSE